MNFRFKTIIGIALIETVMLFILILSVLSFLNTSHEKEMNQRAKSTAKLFATMSTNAVLASDLDSLEIFVSELLKNEDIVYARIIGDDLVLAQGGLADALKRPFKQDVSLEQVNDNIFDVSSVIEESNSIYGRVEIGLSISRIQSVLEQAKQWSISIAAFEVIMVAIFSFILGTWLTRQLSLLKKASEIIADEGPGYQVLVNSTDEVAMVAKSFNIMSRSLLDSSNELKLAAYAFEAQEAIFICDSESKILRVNHAFTKITGYCESEVLGKTPKLLSSGRQDKAFYKNLWQTLEEKSHWEGEIYNKRKNGDVYPEWLGITAVKNTAGICTHYIAHFVDISQQKKTENDLKQARFEAEQASQAKSKFLATMSHEIRTPMNAILGTMGLMKDLSLDEEQTKYVDLANNSAKSLLCIINDILDFSKIEAGKLDLNYQPCFLANLVDEIVLMLSAQADRQQLKLNAYIASELPDVILTDIVRLRQILVNLVNNALKFTQAGRVQISVLSMTNTQQENVLRFEIKDTGIGIEVSEQEKLFDAFSQVENHSSRRYEGSGLGLAICHQLVVLLGGEIGVESESGKGSLFWFTLPLIKAERADVVKQNISQDSHQSYRLLLAEDSEANIVVSTALLTKAGHQLDVARNGLEAVESVRRSIELKQPYDLILMDLMMPEMDGIEATQCIREMDSSVSQIPIVAMTANVMKGDKERCIDSGMQDYISKPYHAPELLQLIQEVIYRSKNNKTPEQVNQLKQKIIAEEETISIEIPENDTVNENKWPLLEEKILKQLAEDTSAELVPQMIEIFIGEIDKRRALINQALEVQNAEDIAKQVHALKSSAGTYGALRLQSQAVAIDELFKEDEHQQVLMLVAQLTELIVLTIDRYKEYFSQ